MNRSDLDLHLINLAKKYIIEHKGVYVTERILRVFFMKNDSFISKEKCLEIMEKIDRMSMYSRADCFSYNKEKKTIVCLFTD